MVQLARLPFAQIKIDKTFVMSLVESEQSRKIVDCIIHLAQALGLASIAEGVEAADALQLLAGLGCDQAQGYFSPDPWMPWPRTTGCKTGRRCTRRRNARALRPVPKGR